MKLREKLIKLVSCVLVLWDRSEQKSFGEPLSEYTESRRGSHGEVTALVNNNKIIISFKRYYIVKCTFWEWK